ncbi:unnamed protein product [Eruca vesicaria subsp. sativa]|uniref:Uncharacterized protein n=1 Tax=Eruca vesicaria subsp. sativa TaxID=29727 RepID=A0ABC8M1F0_ERUVS|nr:unnamed protein product [Eruca vesicaria subsp. sativa]
MHIRSRLSVLSSSMALGLLQILMITSLHLISLSSHQETRILAQLEDDVVLCESQMENWKTNLEVMAAKEEQYIQQ